MKMIINSFNNSRQFMKISSCLIKMIKSNSILTTISSNNKILNPIKIILMKIFVNKNKSLIMFLTKFHYRNSQLIVKEIITQLKMTLIPSRLSISFRPNIHISTSKYLSKCSISNCFPPLRQILFNKKFLYNQ